MNPESHTVPTRRLSEVLVVLQVPLLMMWSTQ
jgi:hypothetical protein